MRLMALHALAIERELDEADVEAAMDSGEPKAALIQLLQTAVARPPSEASRIAAALAEGGGEEREAAYATLEGAVRGSDGREQAVALAVACVKPLIVSVLCAPASRIAATEWRRASLLLYELCKLDFITVCGEMARKDETGVPLWIRIDTAPNTVFAAMIAKAPSEGTRDDASTAAVGAAPILPMLVPGADAVMAEAGGRTIEFMGMWFTVSPYLADNPQPADRYLPLALLCLDLVRSELDTQPEGVIVGAFRMISNASYLKPPVAAALLEAGFFDVARSSLQRYNPIERVMRRNLIPSAILNAMVDLAVTLGTEAVQPFLDAGAVDIVISTLTAYQMLGKPDEVSVVAVQYGGLTSLEALNLSSPEAQPIVAKIRSAGVDSFRFMLDNPLVLMADFGFETGVSATKIAALVRSAPFCRCAL